MFQQDKTITSIKTFWRWFVIMIGPVSVFCGALALFGTENRVKEFAVLAYVSLWVLVIQLALTNHKLMKKINATKKSDLEIEPVISEKFPAKKHPLHIRVVNKNPKLNADDLKVEIVSFADNLAAQFQSVAQRYYHPSHFDKVAELKSATGKNTINPNDGLEFTVFYFEASWKIQGRARSVVATFDLKGGTVKENVASFNEGKKYQIKFAASARGFSKIEREFNMEFFDDDGICKIKLTPFVPLTKEEIRQKSERAVEKLNEYATIFFQYITSNRGIDPAKYDPQQDKILFDANDAAIVYIQLNLNQDAVSAYDEGVPEITIYSVQKSGFGSTRKEDEHKVILERFNRRLVNIKRIVDNIEKYIK
jgi:hypothetical protein